MDCTVERESSSLSLYGVVLVSVTVGFQLSNFQFFNSVRADDSYRHSDRDLGGVCLIYKNNKLHTKGLFGLGLGKRKRK